MSLHSLQDLYIDELKDVYSAEHQVLKALPKMIKGASAPELKNAFNEHMEQTRTQIERLERIFDELGKAPRGKKCVGMEGLVEEGSEMLKENGEPSVKDAGLISAAQRVEHYEMAAYGTLRTYAQMLGYDEQACILQETLDEEGETDHKLTALAQNTINTRAESGGDEEGMSEDEEMGDEEMMSSRKSR